MTKRIAIVGAGISGLATAHYLRRGLSAAALGADLVILESDRVPGGTMRTVREDGFFIEWGPNGFLANKPHTLDLVRELGMEARLQRSSDSARRRYVFVRGRLRRMPETPFSFLASDLLTLPGRLRVLAEPFAPPPPAGKDESVAEFASRRLGAEAMEKLIEPMTAGVFAGDPDKLSLGSCFPRIRELESRYGGLIKAMLSLRWERRMGRASAVGPDGRPKEMSAGPGGALTSFDNGVAVLIEALAGKLSSGLRLNAVVESIARRDGRWVLSVQDRDRRAEESADAVVLACPAHAASRIVGRLDPALADELGLIPYVPVAVAALGYDAASLRRPLDGFGFLVPRTEGRRILGALWDSSVFPGRAPQGRALVRVMVGGARQPALARQREENILALAREELALTMGLRAEPVLAKVFAHERAIPQYPVGHAEALGRIDGLVRAHQGLHLNSNAYLGIGLNDCVLRSRLAAERVLRDLAGPAAMLQ
ncbi:MAG: protoporphyrinogen oxidase [Elusimicrobia bacterium]|nr:protoporphyrinogen oxidase [Elusimicrobiota bacterium]